MSIDIVHLFIFLARFIILSSARLVRVEERLRDMINIVYYYSLYTIVYGDGFRHLRMPFSDRTNDGFRSANDGFRSADDGFRPTQVAFRQTKVVLRPTARFFPKRTFKKDCFISTRG